MKKKTSLSVEASEFLSAIGAYNSDFELNKIRAINIYMPVNDGLSNYFPYPLTCPQ